MTTQTLTQPLVHLSQPARPGGAPRRAAAPGRHDQHINDQVAIHRAGVAVLATTSGAQ